MEDPICCEPRRDVFLAVTEIMPFEPEIHRISSEELKQYRERLIGALYKHEYIKFDLSDEIFTEETRELDEVYFQDEQNEKEQLNISKESKLDLHL